MKFKDHFSGHAAEYAKFRPHYPDELFEYLASISPRRELAWDCATGNGQAAVGLARHFNAVIATDASAQQIERAEPDDRISYQVAPAEASGNDSASVDKNIELPFPELPPIRFEMCEEWNLHQLAGYLRAWSATQKFVAAHGFDPVDSLVGELGAVWKNPEQVREIRWPLHLRVGVFCR